MENGEEEEGKGRTEGDEREEAPVRGRNMCCLRPPNSLIRPCDRMPETEGDSYIAKWLYFRVGTRYFDELSTITCFHHLENNI